MNVYIVLVTGKTFNEIGYVYSNIADALVNAEALRNQFQWPDAEVRVIERELMDSALTEKHKNPNRGSTFNYEEFMKEIEKEE